VIPAAGPEGTLRWGAVGLGAAARAMLSALAAHPQIQVVAGADPDDRARAVFTAAHGVPAVPTLTELLARWDVDVVYVATPTPLHPAHVLEAFRAGVHVVVEKPMAPSVPEARSMVAAAAEAGRVLVVGHSQSFEAPVRAMRALIESGRVGALRAVNCWYFTDWMYRPRHPDELDETRGGGVPLRQGAHHADIVRFLGGGLLRSVRGSVGRWDPGRPAAGAYTAFLEFEDGTPATMVYSGYDHFPSSELTFGIGESGRPVGPGYALARAQLTGLTAGEELEHKRGSAGPSRQDELLSSGDAQPFFGLVVVSCEGADMRVGPQGLIVYGDSRRVEIPLRGMPSGRGRLVEEVLDAVRGRGPATHDGPWGLANLEVCAALGRSAAARQEIVLEHQVALRAQPSLAGVIDAAGDLTGNGTGARPAPDGQEARPAATRGT
jgi:phthalate 4,5-cis-dihydrodiol dehydrogenase